MSKVFFRRNTHVLSCLWLFHVSCECFQTLKWQWNQFSKSTDTAIKPNSQFQCKYVKQTCSSTSSIGEIIIEVQQWLLSGVHGKMSHSKRDVSGGRGVKTQTGRWDIISSHWLLPRSWRIYGGIGLLTEHSHLPAELCEITNEKWVIK